MNISKFILAVALLSSQCFADQSNQFQYAEMATVKVAVDIDEVDDLHGFGLEAKYNLYDYVYVNGAYQSYQNDLSDNNRVMVGGGVKYPVSDLVIPFIQYDRIEVSTDFKDGDFEFNTSQDRFGVGVAGSVGGFMYKAGVSRYFLEDELEDETVPFLEAGYRLGTSYALYLKGELSDDSDIFSLTARYQF